MEYGDGPSQLCAVFDGSSDKFCAENATIKDDRHD